MSLEVIVTQNGKIKGKVVEPKVKDGKPVYVYRKIPFAKPPLGKLRFMPPQPAEPWEGVKDGTTVGNMPMFMSNYVKTMEKAFPMPRVQKEFTMNEDCLYLTVYSPSPEKGKNLPVMVWLYGGGFSMGSEPDYEGSVIASLNDVVLVIPNYRVSIFGFFSLGKNSSCSGNAGILDQQMALKWVQENICEFGGDKTNVTIFGESAGAISTHLQIVSPLARGLFHKAISHSGQVYMPVVFNSKEANEKVVKITLEHFKMKETNDDLKILEALQEIPAEELVKVSAVFEKAQIQFYPMIDGVAFEKTPAEYLAENEFSKVPYIIGCNSTEGCGLFGLFIGPDFEKGISEEMCRTILPTKITDEGWKKCKEFYEVDKMGDDRFSRLLGNIYGDSFFIGPALRAADVHAASGSPVYKYLGNFQLKYHHDMEYGKDVSKKPDWCICDHGDDIMLTFGFPFNPYPAATDHKYSKEEEDLSRQWMTYITNFAKTGDPNLGTKVATEWPKYNAQKQHLVVDHNLVIGKGFREKEGKFWLETMPAHAQSGTNSSE